MKLASSDDSLTLKSEEDTSKLTIIFENMKQGKRTEFAMNLLTLDSEVLGIPEKDFQARITTGSGEFTKLCRDLYQVAETVSIEAVGDSAVFAVEGDMGKGRVALAQAESDKIDERTSIEVKETVKLSFALRYLNMFNKASSCAPSVSLLLSSETPLVVEYTMDNLGSIKFYLAPKISEDKD
eukprot:TRINITY_DN4260_c0_g7_i1.p1 TRINITY_DN4260_c0_g7~~TRINITY_DN4260_c0_g7_i1.p1  ORF type:complete len:182 (-),score=55.31 TRINITY_DN4260_c0_g7_i1:113-658(-)